MKINYEKLEEVLKPYNLRVKEGRIVGNTPTQNDCTFMHLTSLNVESIKQNIKNNKLNNLWVSTINMLIPILHPHYNEIFERTINKEKLIEVFKKYGGWKVDGDDLYIPQNDADKINYYDVDILIRKYTLRDCTTPSQDVLLSFMHHHEDEFME